MERPSIPKHIKNPLTLIGVFAGLAQVAGTVVLPALRNEAIQLTFVWYVMLFPVLLVLAFFLTLNFNPRVLYSPSDWIDESLFYGPKEQTAARYTSSTEDMETLRNYWKPQGTINKQNERKLKDWLNSNGINSESITLFLRNDLLNDARRKAIKDLRIET
jgi:hypothetical protein